MRSEIDDKKLLNFFFFFKQKTAYEMCGRDWSSDVCSSDLPCRCCCACFAGNVSHLVASNAGQALEVSNGGYSTRTLYPDCD